MTIVANDTINTTPHHLALCIVSMVVVVGCHLQSSASPRLLTLPTNLLAARALSLADLFSLLIEFSLLIQIGCNRINPVSVAIFSILEEQK